MTNGDRHVCPECESPVDPATHQFCPRCGYPLATARRPAQPPPLAPEPPPTADGPPAQPDEPDWADQDRERDVEGRQVGPEARTCPSCGHVNVPSRVRCAQCGTAIGVVATLVELPPSPAAPQPRLARDRWPIVVTVLAVVAVLLAVAAIIVEAVSSSPRSANRSDDGSPETARVPHQIIQARSDNHLKRSGDLNYFACNVLDGDRATAWNSEPDRGVRSQLLFRFARPVELRSITMVNGYAGDEERFTSNSAITMATISAGGETFAWPLDGDDIAPQVLTKDFGRLVDLALRVDAVRPGSAQRQVAITEVWFDEEPPSSASAEPGLTRTLDVSCPPESP